MSVVTQGIGSGLDITTLITDLVNATETPRKTNLELSETKLTARLSGVATMKNALADFKTAIASHKLASSYSGVSATSADTGKYTATATSTAVAGNYDIEVVSVATAQKYMSAGFSADSTVVGTGVMTITTDGGSSSFTVGITTSNDELSQVRDAINNAADNTGVQATIISVDKSGGGTEKKLIFTTTDIGAGNTMQITVDDDDSNDSDASGLSQLVTANLTETQAPTNAQIKVDSQTLTSTTSNTLSEVASGVDITVLSADVGNTYQLTVARNTSAVSAMVGSFVTAYNTMRTTLNTLTSYDSTTGATGALFADGGIRSFNSVVHRTILNDVSGATTTMKSLASIGIEVSEDDGLLSIDNTRLTSALTNYIDDFDDIFANTNGVATNLDAFLNAYTLSTTGILDQRTESLNDSVARITAEKAKLTLQMDQLRIRLNRQFNAMDTLVGTLDSTSTFLNDQLDVLLNMVNKKK